MSIFTTAQDYVLDGLQIQVDWCDEDRQVADCFDENSDTVEMQARCDSGEDVHYMLRVQAWDAADQDREVLLSDNHLGSCYASGCSPEEDIATNVAGYLDDMIAATVKEAKEANH
jgi:hypothetical protein